ncbi:DUF3025 domain-containing protein [uncultured Pseudacidovorax sp.]|uniref:DUF3025 domain-containing protein n=1 Tax=uncultured Pseudacidovorax sp. TaxID=679313 RepID=UPI0025DBD0CC|nr:DUF3025 domain-containing protein [uncultured Pseudacidovorax sp.]
MNAAAAIDWAHPGLAPWRRWGEPAAHAAAGLRLHAALQALAAPPQPGFVPQEALPDGEPYECFIDRTGTVPTRDNLHDFFNGLVWLGFPRAKRQLGRLQAAEIAAHGIGPVRGRLRDAITLFDEHGAILQAPPVLWAALQAREWRRAFVALRPLWAEARLTVFGHALMEKLVAGQKSATAHLLLGPDPRDPSLPTDDGHLADTLAAEWLTRKPFTPLPVAGVPGWHPGNTNFCFYDDSEVFRPRRTADPEQLTSVRHAVMLEAGRGAPIFTASLPPTEKPT